MRSVTCCGPEIWVCEHLGGVAGAPRAWCRRAAAIDARGQRRRAARSQSPRLSRPRWTACRSPTSSRRYRRSVFPRSATARSFQVEKGTFESCPLTAELSSVRNAVGPSPFVSFMPTTPIPHPLSFAEKGINIPSPNSDLLSWEPLTHYWSCRVYFCVLLRISLFISEEIQYMLSVKFVPPP